MVIFVDVSKAYDRVQHSILLNKLIQLQVPQEEICWVADWLTNRNYTVRVHGKFSTMFQLEAGIPQGSPISSVLWKSYVHDFHSQYLTDIWYMDDYCGICNSYHKMERALRKLEIWASNNFVTFNEYSRDSRLEYVRVISTLEYI